ncbi:MAG: Phenylalanyl-tRNA synthetase, beta subunit, partial [uncultured bacterium]
MDIKIPHSLLLNYLDTKATPAEIAKALTLCGPSVDRLTKVGDDVIYETEIITNRIDSVSAFGLAREAAAILPQFGHQAKLINNPYEEKHLSVGVEHDQPLPLNIQILDQSLVHRFSALVLDNLNVKPSPNLLQHQLESAGIRSLNNLVDITNYLTLSLGQPVHIFDYDKLSEHLLKLRSSKKGETVTTLDHKTHLLRGGDIVIEDGSGKIIDLCGIMGGLFSEIDEHTKRAVLFVQTYDSKKIRSTSLYTQERTLAAQI